MRAVSDGLDRVPVNFSVHSDRSARAGKSVDVQDGAALFLPKAPAALLSGPLIAAFTFMAVMAFWKQAPEVSETAKLVYVQQGVPGQPLPPPALPKSVPSHMKSHVDQAVWATKVAWLMESKRVNVTGEDISDERLNQLYLSGRNSYSRHATNPEVRANNRTGCFRAGRVCMPLHASQMKTYATFNETQKRSFDQQLVPVRAAKLLPRTRAKKRQTPPLPRISTSSNGTAYP